MHVKYLHVDTERLLKVLPLRPQQVSGGSVDCSDVLVVMRACLVLGLRARVDPYLPDDRTGGEVERGQVSGECVRVDTCV